jgi:hypothetical protein
VEQREPDRPLQLRVALDDDVGVEPAPRPLLAVLAQLYLSPGLLGRG